jgi:hypothetical protein
LLAPASYCWVAPIHLGRDPQAVPAHITGIEREAELQRLPYRHRQRRHVFPGHARPSADALGPDPTLVVEASQRLDDALSTFNARVKTVTTKPFFREAFKRTRCIIPASGYYE